MLLKKDNLQASPQDIALLLFCFCRCLFVFLGSCVFCFRSFQTNLVSESSFSSSSVACESRGSGLFKQTIPANHVR